MPTADREAIEVHLRNTYDRDTGTGWSQRALADALTEHQLIPGLDKVTKNDVSRWRRADPELIERGDT